MTETAEVYETEVARPAILERDLEQFAPIKVVDEESYVQAAKMLKALKEHRNKVENFFAETKKRAYDLWKHTCKQEGDLLIKNTAIDTMVRTGVNAYLNEQENIRLKAQRKAEEEAMLVAEKEKQRLLEQAVKAEEKGNVDKAEALVEKAEAVYREPVVVPSTVEKTTRLDTGGSITRQTETQVIIQDEQLIIKAIAAGLVPATVIEFKLNTLRTWVKTAGIKNGQIPGLLIKKVQKISAR